MNDHALVDSRIGKSLDAIVDEAVQAKRIVGAV